MGARSVWLGVLLAACLCLSGCGGSSPESERKPAASASPTPSAQPAEPDECRAILKRLDALAGSLEVDVEYNSLRSDFARLQRLQSLADNTCSGQVMRPLSMATYKLSLINLEWSVCESQGFCDSSRFGDRILAIAGRVRSAVEVGNRTQS